MFNLLGVAPPWFATQRNISFIDPFGDSFEKRAQYWSKMQAKLIENPCMTAFKLYLMQFMALVMIGRPTIFSKPVCC